MGYISRFGSVVYDSLDLSSSRSAGEYLLRALWLIIAVAAVLLAMWWIGERDGSALWLIPPFLALVMASANGIWPLRNALESFGIGGPDDLSSLIAFPFVILFAVVIPVLLAMVSPLILLWTLLNAARAALR